MDIKNFTDSSQRHITGISKHVLVGYVIQTNELLSIH